MNLKLSNLGLQMFIDAQKSRTEIFVIKKQQRETEAMFESLQEGIVVIQDNSIAFMNSLFKRLFDKKMNFLD